MQCMHVCKKTKVAWPYFVTEGLVERCILSLQLMNFFVELGLNVGGLDLKVLQGVDASLHNFG